MRHNDVLCHHIVNNKEHTFHVNDVFPVNIDTPYEDLYDAAKSDQDQFLVVKVTNWRGEIITRSTLEFLVLFDDGTKVWKGFLDNDFKSNSLLQEYTDASPALLSLKYTLKDWKVQHKVFNAEPIILFTKCFVDYRMYSLGWRKKVK